MARTETLDRSRPYGVVTGDEFVKGKRVAFEVARGKGRRSKIYDVEGVRIFRDAAEEAEGKGGGQPPAPRRGRGGRTQAQAAPPPPADDDENDDDEEELPPLKLDEDGDDGEGDVTVVTSDDVNLTAWLLKQEKYRFAAIREAIKNRYSREVTNEQDAIEFLLVEEKLVTEAEYKKATGKK